MRNFYILIEGTPNSPETPFLRNLINKIFDNTQYIPQIIEVGGSSSFNSSAKVCYRMSQIHDKIPVLAIADKDYRTKSETISSEENSKLIKDKKAKILYWQRHEWENYLLDELVFILEYLNKLPQESEGEKPSKKSNEITLTVNDLEDWLKQYFKNTIKEEFWECLKFNLSRKIDKYPQIKKPDSFNKDKLDFCEIQTWFDEEIKINKAEFELKKKPDNLFQEMDKEFSWSTYLEDPQAITLDKGKEIFRGKETFKQLYVYLYKQLKLHNLTQEHLVEEILKYWRDTKQDESIIYQDIKFLLSEELKGSDNK